MIGTRVERDGLRVRVRRVPGAPVVALRVMVGGGARVEEVPGQALITGRMLAEGTRRRDWRRLAEDLESRGMILQTSGSTEAVGIALDALAPDLERALDWAAEILFEPAFAPDRCDWVRRQAAAELESLADQPEVLTAWGFQEQLYTPHPRARPLHGDAASLARLTTEDCSSFLAAGLARGLLVTLTGDLDEEEAADRVAAVFARAAGAAASPAEPPEPQGGGPRREVRLRGGDQAHLYLGHLTVPRTHPEYTALEVLAVILGAGSGLAGRVPTRIREREGLAYSTFAQTVAGAGLDPGRFMAYVGTGPENLDQAEASVRDELARLLAAGVTEPEVGEARAYLAGREPFRRETARQWAEILAEAEVYGLPVDDPQARAAALAAVDRTAVEAAARRHLHPEAIKVTVGLPG
ncbi:MAG TPA: pitrilysin family protein [Thermoanaerobaculia bacterium]|nr:pitrilysin family protein [Thermoanaerobaculia bacterium]